MTKPLASWLTITNLTLEEYHCFPSRLPTSALTAGFLFTVPSAVQGNCCRSTDQGSFLSPNTVFSFCPEESRNRWHHWRTESAVSFFHRRNLHPRKPRHFSLPSPSINSPSLPAITFIQSALISFPSSSRLPLPDAATIQIPVCNTGCQPVVCTRCIYIFFRKRSQLSMANIFSDMICPSLSVKNSRGVPSFESAVLSYFFRNHNPAQVVNPANNSRCFHLPNSSCTFYLFIAASGSYWFNCMDIM